MIVAFYGYRGSGKTLSMAYHAVDELRQGRRLITNMNMTNLGRLDRRCLILDRAGVLALPDMAKDDPGMFDNASIFLSELHLYIDSRKSMSNLNRLFSYMITQSRKLGKNTTHFFYDTQRDTQVDIRARDNIDHEIYPTVLTGIKDGQIVPYDHVDWMCKPHQVQLLIYSKFRHKIYKRYRVIVVDDVLDKYDTHQLFRWE